MIKNSFFFENKKHHLKKKNSIFQTLIGDNSAITLASYNTLSLCKAVCFFKGI